MRINSIVKSNQYNTHKELDSKHEKKRIRKENDQVISFSDILNQIGKNSTDNKMKCQL